MSAIAGLVRPDQDQDTTEALARMHQALAWHGPDGGETWFQAGVGLAQRQMAVCPEDVWERQPLSFAAGRYRLVSDLRLDNRMELAAALGIAPRERDSLPDSALLAQAWECWGEATPKHLVGDYAFAIWDGASRQLFLARSPLGCRPLYYHMDARGIVFATLPQVLYALPWIPRGLALGAEPNRTVYRSLRQVTPGHVLCLRDGKLNERAFWRLDLNHRLNLCDDRAYEEAYRERLDTVVAGMLRGTRGHGVMLSGGLDSSAVAATAARQLVAAGGGLAAYTQVPPAGFSGGVPPNHYADETPFVQAILARHANLSPNWIVSRDHPLDGLETFFEAALHPFQNLTNWGWMRGIYALAAEQGVRALFTGGNGNLTLSWNGAGLLPGLLRRGAWWRAWREAVAVARASRARPARVLWGQGVRPVLSTIRPSPPARAPDGGEYSPWRAGGATALELPPPAGHPAARRTRYAALRPEGSGHYSAALQALFGVQERDPSSDIRLIEFCFAVPESQWLWRGVARALPRRALTDRLPALVLENRRRGYQAAEWWEGILPRRAEFAADLARLAESAAAREFLDLPRLGRLIDRLPEQPVDAAQSIRALYGQVMLRGLAMGRFLAWYEARWGGDITP